MGKKSYEANQKSKVKGQDDRETDEILNTKYQILDNVQIQMTKNPCSEFSALAI